MATAPPTVMLANARRLVSLSTRLSIFALILGKLDLRLLFEFLLKLFLAIVKILSYKLTNVTLNDGYWGETNSLTFPSQNVFAGWLELAAGVRVRIKGPIAMGWMFRYKMLLHQSHPSTGDAWYIPGFGSVTAGISGSFSIFYDIPINKKSLKDKKETNP